MNRHSTIPIAVALFLTTVLQAATIKPNVLIILADDQRADCVGVLNPHIRTPNIDRIARNGVLFKNCYIAGGHSAAVCTPSRTQFMTGRNPYHLPNDIKAEGNKPSVPAMPTIFGPAGFDTFYCGKHGNTYHPADRAFDKFTPINASGMRKEYDEVLKRERGFPDLVTEYLADPARKQKPFFIYYAPSIPHDPLWPEPEDLAYYMNGKVPTLAPNAAADHKSIAGFNLRDTNVRTYDVPQMGQFKTPLDLDKWREVNARYHAYVTTLDRQVGKILDGLKRAGADQNTIIVFSSDNGHSQADQGLIHKQSVYEQDIRVPLIVSGPGIPAGKSSEALVYLSDVLPTLCELTGVKIPETVQTRSFKNALLDPAQLHRDRLTCLYIEEMRSLRDGQHKIILFENGVAELYDLKNDPYETRNLAKDPAHDDLMRKMIAQARKMAADEGDEVKNATPKPEKFLRTSGETPKLERSVKFWTRFDQAVAKTDGAQ